MDDSSLARRPAIGTGLLVEKQFTAEDAESAEVAHRHPRSRKATHAPWDTAYRRRFIRDVREHNDRRRRERGHPDGQLEGDDRDDPQPYDRDRYPVPTVQLDHGRDVIHRRCAR